MRYLLRVCGRCLALIYASACGGQAEDVGQRQPTSSLSPSGYPIVHLPDGSLPSDVILTDPVRIGANDGVTFGLISDVEVSSTHGIVVMDYQASELRRFQTSGAELPPLAELGAGPGEIRKAIGIAVQRDGTVWVNDFGNARYAWYPSSDLTGSSHAEPIRWYGLLEGGVTDGGQPWVRQNHTLRGSLSDEGGLIRSTIATYLVPVDLGGDAVPDSIFLGVSSVEFLDFPMGAASRRIPYTNERLVAFSPDGAVWTAESDQYKLVRQSLAGDTTVVIDVDTSPVHIAEEDRLNQIAVLEEWFRSVGAEVPPLDEAFPKIYPRIDKLATDPQGRVWVQRRGLGSTQFEVFTPDGRSVGRYYTDVTPWVDAKPAVGRQVLAVIVADSLDVQCVLAWRIPR